MGGILTAPAQAPTPAAGGGAGGVAGGGNEQAQAQALFQDIYRPLVRTPRDELRTQHYPDGWSAWCLGRGVGPREKKKENGKECTTRDW